MSTSPSVLFVINGLGTGGAERSLAELLPRFRDAGWSCHVAAFFERDEGVAGSVDAAGFDVRIVRSKNVLGRAIELRRLIRALRPDVVHTAIFEADVAGRLASLGAGVAVVSTLVNTSYEDARLSDPNVKRWRLRAAQLVDAVTARVAVDHFIAITEAVAQSASARLRLPRDRMTVIHRGREPGRLGEPSAARRAAARAALGLGDDDDVVVTVGRQEYQKGHVHLLDAVSVLATRRPALRLLLAGRKGNASAELERRDVPGVRYLGHVDDVASVLAAGDVFAFPSLYEGLGGALLEAMALGLPIVATDIPAVREVVVDGTNAILVPPASGDALATAIEELLGDPDRRARFGAASRARFVEHFTIDEMARRTIDLFTRVSRRSDTESVSLRLESGEGRRPRVHWVIKGLGPGGAETLLALHARRADHSSFEHSLTYTLAHKDHLAAAVRGAGVDVHAPRGGRGRWLLDVHRLMRAGDVDVVHTHSPLAAAAVRVASRVGVRPSLRPRLVYTEHNRWPSHHPLTRLANRLTLRLEDHVFAVSDEVRATMPAGPLRVETLVHGIDVDEAAGWVAARDEVRRELGFADGEVVAVTVANYREKKDYPTLLAAAALAVERMPALRFVAIGQGPLAGEIEELHASLGLGERFLLLGYRPDAVRVMAACDVFVLSSLHEGLPVALMEALAVGLPVVATDVGGIPEAVSDGHEARLVPAGSPEALADAVVSVAGDASLRSSMAARARVTARRFDGSAAVRRQEAVYRELAAGRRRRRRR